MKLAAFLLVSALAAGTAPPPHSKAETWSEAVARFVTDPQFYRQVRRDQVKFRFLPLLPPGQLNFETGSGIGRNPATGILHVFANLQSTEKDKSGIESILLVMPETDPSGVRIFPILKAKLQRRLRGSLWHVASVGGKRLSWRKGKSPYIVSVDLDNFYTPETPRPGPGPYVIVEAAWEEGYGEEDP